MTLRDDTENENRATSQGASQYAIRNTHYGLNRQLPCQAKPTPPIIYLQRSDHDPSGRHRE